MRALTRVALCPGVGNQFNEALVSSKIVRPDLIPQHTRILVTLDGFLVLAGL